MQDPVTCHCIASFFSLTPVRHTLQGSEEDLGLLFWDDVATLHGGGSLNGLNNGNGDGFYGGGPAAAPAAGNLTGDVSSAKDNANIGNINNNYYYANGTNNSYISMMNQFASEGGLLIQPPPLPPRGTSTAAPGGGCLNDTLGGDDCLNGEAAVGGQVVHNNNNNNEGISNASPSSDGLTGGSGDAGLMLLNEGATSSNGEGLMPDDHSGGIGQNPRQAQGQGGMQSQGVWNGATDNSDTRLFKHVLRFQQGGSGSTCTTAQQQSPQGQGGGGVIHPRQALEQSHRVQVSQPPPQQLPQSLQLQSMNATTPAVNYGGNGIATEASPLPCYTDAAATTAVTNTVDGSSQVQGANQGRNQPNTIGNTDQQVESVGTNNNGNLATTSLQQQQQQQGVVASQIPQVTLPSTLPQSLPSAAHPFYL